MIVPCRKCGLLADKKNVMSFEDLKCNRCNNQLIKQEPEKILTSCKKCNLAQSVPIRSYHGFDCKSCGHKNKHPIKKPLIGFGHSFGVEHTKTTINIDSDLLQRLDEELLKINKDVTKKKPGKEKTGKFIRMLLKQHFGFKF